jgi:hypothetical protein
VIATHRAVLESDRETLKNIAGWPADRDYKVDPLAGLIADTWADHLFGEELELTPAADSDAVLLEALAPSGELIGDLHEAERGVVGEGEQWFRVYVDKDVSDVPLCEWHGRDEVIPLYVGRRLMAAALVTELEQASGKGPVYRHLEVHVEGAVEHVLFRGTRTKIGQTVPLEEHPELEDIAAILPGEGTTRARVWAHGLPMMMGRVVNGRRQDRKLGIGVSDFHRIADFLLDLNEAATIGAENARLTAKRRVVVPEDSLRPRRPELMDTGYGTLIPVGNNGATFDAGEDVLVVSKLDAELGQSADGQFKVLEYSFDAEALIAYKRDLVETALTRIGLTPRYAGIQTGESTGVLSGTAYRLTLIPTTKAGAGKGRAWDGILPHVLGLMQRLDALPEADGGFGRSWANALDAPAIERANPLPQDEVEDAQVEATLVGAGLRSRKTSIRRQHPEWDDDMVDEELELIAEERPATSAAFGAGLA